MTVDGVNDVVDGANDVVDGANDVVDGEWRYLNFLRIYLDRIGIIYFH
jgi:X-X-X-Leu-X-X-Gly heptad repeat protein